MCSASRYQSGGSRPSQLWDPASVLCFKTHECEVTTASRCRYTGLFISPTGISELDCATTKTDTAERSISIGRESLQVFFFFVLGALAYLQVSPLAGSRDEKWRSQWIRKRSVSWNLPKLSQLWRCNGGFGSCTTQNHLRTKQFVSGTWNSSRVAACALRNEEAVRAHRLRLSSVCEKRLSGALRSQQLERAGNCRQDWNLERFSTYWYAPFCRVCLGCCAVEFGNPGGTYE